MKILLELLSENSELPTSTITAIKYHTIEKPLNTYPNTNLISHDKHVDKEYFVEDQLELHEEFPIIFGADLTEFGFAFEGELHTDLGDTRGLRYDVHGVDKRLAVIELRGVLTGGYGEMDEDALCRIKVRAISKADYIGLSLHETLAIEAHLLEAEGNYKMAFFTYFSAAEAALRIKTDKVKGEIYDELRGSLEHLSLDDKIKIAGKHTFKTKDFTTIPLWGDYMGAIRDCKTVRNDIAHGLKAKTFTRADVGKSAACYIITQQALLNGLSSMKDIINIYKPKKKIRSR